MLGSLFTNVLFKRHKQTAIAYKKEPLQWNGYKNPQPKNKTMILFFTIYSSENDFNPYR